MRHWSYFDSSKHQDDPTSKDSKTRCISTPNWRLPLAVSTLGLAILVGRTAEGQDDNLSDALIFHATYDESGDADMAAGDAKLYTATSLRRDDVREGIHTDAVKLESEAGKFGGCLQFIKKAEPVVFYRGGKNANWSPTSFQGTYSFWLRLTPNTDLEPGYVDPLQITDKKWNDASFFVDFTDKNPRHFRLGVFSDYSFWNPDDRPWDEIEGDERPLVTVTEPPFRNDQWTHVAITFEGLNDDGSSATATLYLDGKSQGNITGKQQISWDAEKVVIMLGINYVGGFDDFGIFDRALTEPEIRQVHGLPRGLASLARQ